MTQARQTLPCRVEQRLVRSGRPFSSVPILVLGLAILLPPSALQGQGGAVLIRVTGSEGPIPGIAMELLMADSVVRTGASDASGAVRWVRLPPGTYRIRAEALGYRPWGGEAFTLAEGEARVVEVALETAPVELEGITVRVDRIQIQRKNTDFSTTVDEGAIQLLPVAYDAKDLVALTPGARAEYVWGGANFQANSYRLDGLSANHPGLGGSLIQPSTNWIERVEVSGLGAGAEYGGFQGGQVNVATKSGGNDFSAMLRSTLSGNALASSNLVASEIGSEVTTRYDVEGDVRGAVIRDRLFYYLGGTYTDRSARFLNHVDFNGRFLPVLENRTEEKAFGKITWARSAAEEVELSGSYLDVEADNYGMTGYEAPGAMPRYSSPTWFGHLSWRRPLGGRAILEAQINHFGRNERSDPHNGPGEPGIRLFSLTPPYTTFGNAPFALRSASISTSARVMTTIRFHTGGQEHLLKIGGEYTRGGFLDRRLRDGGMTWMPVFSKTFDIGNPGTWAQQEEGFTPTEWGGEVHLDADVANTAAFLQSALSFGRLVLTPGLRWGRWQGWMDPRAGSRFEAVEDQALDPRIGATLELTKDGTLVLKGHWGRYHQDMIAQMFDRVGGTDVFTNQEIWNYWGPPVMDPRRPFTEAERDRLAAQGRFTLGSVISLNETGPVAGYRQPFVDQWLIGLEKQFGSSVKMEAIYTRRSNKDMIALVDRNRDTNYTHFKGVRVHMGSPGGAPLPFSGGSVYLQDLYVPNNVVRDYLKSCAAGPVVCTIPPEISMADTLILNWNPEYVLTTAPDASREFRQLQLTLEVSRPRWGGSFSAVWTGLKGNLDNVSGYEDPADYSPGPYVRLNEGVNAYGSLPNFSDKEGKISAWGVLPWNLRGGVFFTTRSGDHYGPQFRISGQKSLYGYLANAEAFRHLCRRYDPDDPTCNPLRGDPLPLEFLKPLEGNDVFIGPRGKPQMQHRANLDVRLERVFHTQRFDLGVGLDVFNLLGSEAVTSIQTMVNQGIRSFYVFEDISTPFRRLWAGKWYGSPLERVPPRSLRLGVTLYF